MWCGLHLQLLNTSFNTALASHAHPPPTLCRSSLIPVLILFPGAARACFKPRWSIRPRLMIQGQFVYPPPYQYHYSTCELQACEVGMGDEFINSIFNAGYHPSVEDDIDRPKPGKVGLLPSPGVTVPAGGHSGRLRETHRDIGTRSREVCPHSSIVNAACFCV